MCINTNLMSFEKLYTYVITSQSRYRTFPPLRVSLFPQIIPISQWSPLFMVNRALCPSGHPLSTNFSGDLLTSLLASHSGRMIFLKGSSGRGVTPSIKHTFLIFLFSPDEGADSSKDNDPPCLIPWPICAHQHYILLCILSAFPHYWLSFSSNSVPSFYPFRGCSLVFLCPQNSALAAPSSWK